MPSGRWQRRHFSAANWQRWQAGHLTTSWMGGCVERKKSSLRTWVSFCRRMAGRGSIEVGNGKGRLGSGDRSRVVGAGRAAAEGQKREHGEEGPWRAALSLYMVAS